MHHALIFIDPTGPAPIGWSQAAGMPGDIRVDFKGQDAKPYPNITELYPQLVLRPFTNTLNIPFDIVINDPVGSSGIATIEGPIMNDRFSVEVYSRNSIGQPQKLLAQGRVDLTGYGFGQNTALAPATYPTGPVGPPGPAGPVGPAGPAGPTGQRGSRWYSDVGPPTLSPTGRVEGDMWLDESNGDVWRWDATTSTWVGYTRK